MTEKTIFVTNSTGIGSIVVINKEMRYSLLIPHGSIKIPPEKYEFFMESDAWIYVKKGLLTAVYDETGEDVFLPIATMKQIETIVKNLIMFRTDI